MCMGGVDDSLPATIHSGVDNSGVSTLTKTNRHLEQASLTATDITEITTCVCHEREWERHSAEYVPGVQSY